MAMERMMKRSNANSRRKLGGGFLLLLLTGCTTYDPNVVVNPVVAASRRSLAENIPSDGWTGTQNGFVSLYEAEIGTKRFLAIVSDSREKGEPVRAVLLEGRFEVAPGAMKITLFGRDGAELPFEIPSAERSAGTSASESFETLDLEFRTIEGPSTHLEFDFDLDVDDGSCEVSHFVRTSRGFLGMFAKEHSAAAIAVPLESTRSGAETDLWIGDGTPKPAPVEAPAPAKPPAKKSEPEGEAKAPVKSPAPKKPAKPKPPNATGDAKKPAATKPPTDPTKAKPKGSGP